jgi:phosphate transport system ATP-binding protein
MDTTLIEPTEHVEHEPRKEAIRIEGLSIRYGNFLALENIDLTIPSNQVTAIIGPSGCGKSSLLRAINRMNEEMPGSETTGRVLIDGENIYDRATSPVDIRRRVGMVFQQPNPYPTSIYDNIVWGAKINGIKTDYDQLVEESLRQVALWDDLKDRLTTNAWKLSGGQQQRLCLARALALHPEILLMDEPTSSLDPVTSVQIEDLILSLRDDYTFVLASHNLNQAARISDQTVFMLLNEQRAGFIELVDDTRRVFLDASNERLREYIYRRHDHWTH